MKWLIIGGAGFIGTNLVNKLIEENEKVSVMDNFISHEEKEINKRIELLESWGAKVLMLNSWIPESWYSYEDDEFDVVVNLGCPASPKYYKKYALETLMSCVSGTLFALNFADKKNAYFLHASSSEIYGNIPTSIKETDHSLNQTDSSRAIYAEGKRISEAIVNTFGNTKKHGIMRIFNTYGPYMSLADGRVISEFFNSVINNRKLKIEGTGNQSRSFMYINDLIRAIMYLVNNRAQGIYNIGNPNENRSINGLAYLFHQKYSVLSERTGSRDNEIYNRIPNIDKIKNEFSWEPFISLSAGIDRTYEWLISNQSSQE